MDLRLVIDHQDAREPGDRRGDAHDPAPAGASAGAAAVMVITVPGEPSRGRAGVRALGGDPAAHGLDQAARDGEAEAGAGRGAVAAAARGRSCRTRAAGPRAGCRRPRRRRRARTSPPPRSAATRTSGAGRARISRALSSTLNSTCSSSAGSARTRRSGGTCDRDVQRVGQAGAARPRPPRATATGGEPRADLAALEPGQVGDVGEEAGHARRHPARCWRAGRRGCPAASCSQAVRSVLGRALDAGERGAQVVAERVRAARCAAAGSPPWPAARAACGGQAHALQRDRGLVGQRLQRLQRGGSSSVRPGCARRARRGRPRTVRSGRKRQAAEGRVRCRARSARRGSRPSARRPRRLRRASACRARRRARVELLARSPVSTTASPASPAACRAISASRSGSVVGLAELAAEGADAAQALDARRRRPAPRRARRPASVPVTHRDGGEHERR